MGPVEWTTISVLVAILVAAVGAAWWVARHLAEARVAMAEAATAKAVTEAESRVHRAELTAAEAKTAFDHQLLVELRERIPQSGKGYSPGQILQQEIESDLRYVMQELGATECAALVRDPEPGSEYLMFLAAHGPAAPKLRRMLVGPDSIAGRVLRQGRPEIIDNPYGDDEFSPIADKRAHHVTRQMLTVPLYTGSTIVGVAEFLNPENVGGFSAEAAQVATTATASIGLKVAEFVRDTDNFVQLGMYSATQLAEAAVMFCDMSRSSSLFNVLHESGAVICINDYLSQVGEIVLSAGGSIDQYLGDGAMFRFVEEFLPELDATSGNSATAKACNAALGATMAFGEVKQSWLDSRWEVRSVFSRIGIAYGPFREAVIGPSRHREHVVLGATVHRAARICEIAPRDRNVILVDERIADMLRGVRNLSARQVDAGAKDRIDGPVYELIDGPTR
ncbi:GAF domain-containing protein [Flindersiella endophytica]